MFSSLVVGDTDNQLPNSQPTDPYLEVTIGSDTHQYPRDYGLTGCAAHDADMPAEGCADAAGRPLSSAPAWCSEFWCYVDADYCRLGGGAVSSTFFPGATYSVETCVGAPGASVRGSVNSNPNINMDALGGTIIRDYLFNIAANVEQAWAATASIQNCDASMACPCTRCESYSDWACAGDVNLHSSNLFVRSGEPASAEGNRMKCMSSAAGQGFNRIAATEHTDQSRVGFLMFGDQGSGGLLNWPANEWCEAEYDPRFRPWYSSSASGPKDIIIAVDISGSMFANGRVAMAREAVDRVIDTLWWSDHATIVLYDDRAISYSRTLQAMTEDAKATMKSWAQANIRADGGTNFDVAFETSFDIFSSSSRTSACNKVILFMTDGRATLNYDVKGEALAQGVRVMTYALGSGADTTVAKQIACETGGVFSAVGDNADLALAMASYYKVFAAVRPALWSF